MVDRYYGKRRGRNVFDVVTRLVVVLVIGTLLLSMVVVPEKSKADGDSFNVKPPGFGTLDGGNETGNTTTNGTGNELEYPGFNIGWLPNASYTEPPFFESGPLSVRLKSTGSFNPLEGLPPVPRNLTTSYNETDRGRYLLQYTGAPRSSWINDSKTQGASFLGYLQDNSYLISLNASQFTELQNQTYTRWLGIYHAGYKLSPSIQDTPLNDYVNLTIVAFDAANMTLLREHLLSLGITILFEGTGYFLVSALSSSINAIARLDEVQWIEEYHDASLLLDVSSRIINARQPLNGVWTDDGSSSWRFDQGSSIFKGITGAGVSVAVVDTGIDRNHPDFTGKILAFIDYSQEGSSYIYGDGYAHGTHDAGIIAG